jgi:hypothetical protein
MAIPSQTKYFFRQSNPDAKKIEVSLSPCTTPPWSVPTIVCIIITPPAKVNVTVRADVVT